MLTKLFPAWCAAIVMMLAYANHSGYVLGSFLGGPQSAEKSANRYHK